MSSTEEGGNRLPGDVGIRRMRGDGNLWRQGPLLSKGTPRPDAFRRFFRERKSPSDPCAADEEGKKRRMSSAHPTFTTRNDSCLKQASSRPGPEGPRRTENGIAIFIFLYIHWSYPRIRPRFARACYIPPRRAQRGGKRVILKWNFEMEWKKFAACFFSNTVICHDD